MAPRIVIHDLNHARAALAAAAELGVAVTLVSAPGAAAYLGAAVFLEIVAQAHREAPGAAVTAILDCGDDAGLALNALRHGLKTIRLRAAPAIMAAVAEIADQLDAVLDSDPETPALDLLDRHDASGACRAWLLDGATKPD